MIVTISIDDNHPETGWGVEGDIQIEYLEALNKEFGAKFTLFIPSNYHKQYPISQYKDWINFLLSKGYFELAAHGHYHETSDKNIWGECEFFELQKQNDITDRILLIQNEWRQVNHDPLGWRNPGWLASPQSVDVLKQTFKYSAIHYEHNRGLNWGTCKTFYGHDGINTVDIKLHNNNMIMFQSHIQGTWNDNIWNEDNYNQMRLSLAYLTKNHNIIFKTLSECL